MQFAEQLQMWGYRVTIKRCAADVKPWATDKRLEAAGMLGHTSDMKHANDAARHALYTAKHDARMEDPLR
jgi:hypothetical protein